MGRWARKPRQNWSNGPPNETLDYSVNTTTISGKAQNYLGTESIRSLLLKPNGPSKKKNKAAGAALLEGLSQQVLKSTSQPFTCKDSKSFRISKKNNPQTSNLK